MQEVRSQISQPQLTWHRTTPQSGKDWRVQVATTEAEFDALETGWNTLVGHSSCSIFQSFDWLRTWWKYFGKHNTLHIVVLSRGNTIAAIAPFYAETISVLGLAKLSRLAFIGRKTSDYLDVIMRDGMHQEAFPLLADHIQKNRSLWDFVSLEDIPNRSLTHTMLQSALTWRGIGAEAEITEQCPGIVLPATWEEYLSMRSNQFRRELRRREKNLSESFGATYETITEEKDFDAAFTDFVALHQHRWTTQGDAGAFLDEPNKEFHCEAARTLFKKKLVQLRFLRLKGKRVAGSYAFTRGGDLSLYLLGMGEAGAAARFSPGRQLNCHTIQEAIQGGKHVMDFMRGNEEYKYSLGAIDVPNWTLTAYLQPQERVTGTRRKHVANLLYDAFHKRTKKELSCFRQAVHVNGLFSRSTLDYLRRRPQIVFHDVKKKIHSPGKPVYVT